MIEIEVESKFEWFQQNISATAKQINIWSDPKQNYSNGKQFSVYM